MDPVSVPSENINENLLNFNDSDLLTLREYNENLPSTNSTAEIVPEDSSTEDFEKGFTKDIQYEEFDKKPKGQVFNLQNYETDMAERTTKRGSNLTNYLETIEEDLLLESQVTPRANLKISSSKLIPESSLFDSSSQIS